MSCWLPAVAEAPSLRCTLEPLQAHGRNPGLLPEPSSSMGLERLLVHSVPWPPSQEWLFTLSCACPSLLALQCPLNNSGWLSSRGRSFGFPVAAPARLGAWLGAGCSGACSMCQVVVSAGFGAPIPSAAGHAGGPHGLGCNC